MSSLGGVLCICGLIQAKQDRSQLGDTRLQQLQQQLREVAYKPGERPSRITALMFVIWRLCGQQVIRSENAPIIKRFMDAKLGGISLKAEVICALARCVMKAVFCSDLFCCIIFLPQLDLHKFHGE